MRTRSAAVVIEGGHLLVIGRRKDGRAYTVLPGGGIEKGETAREACLRELREETGLEGAIVAELSMVCTTRDSAVYFHVRVPPQEPVLGGPEEKRSRESNVYEPRWVPVAELEAITLVPDHARAAVRSVL